MLPSPPPPSTSTSTAPRRSRFRFKSQSKSKSKSKHKPSHRFRSRSRSPRHRHQHTPSRSPSASPDTAFRESLFDALADDEGAAYWEGVYGQPIHTYARPTTAASAAAAGEEAPAAADPDGKPILERMTDEEYATYVRARMWEKSHQHVVEERERRERVREREREEARDRRKRRRVYEGAETAWESGERGNGERGEMGRTEARDWKRRWERYQQGWEALDEAVANEATPDDQEDEVGPKPAGPTEPPAAKKQRTIPQLPYPTPSRSQSSKDTPIDSADIERFFRNVARIIGDGSGGGGPTTSNGMSGATQAEATTTSSTPNPLLALLKAERVRWHPDKMAQRYGRVLGAEEGKNVTAVFQVVDALFGRVKGEVKDT